MTKRTPEQIYAAALTAGFPAASAQTLTAIALAESNGDDAAVGDVALENATWGPSVGLFQIRTVKAETGDGTDRDISRLAGNIDAQAKAAYDISDHGTDFTPWTTYTSGAYAKKGSAAAGSGSFLDTAKGVGKKMFGLSVSLARRVAGLPITSGDVAATVAGGGLVADAADAVTGQVKDAVAGVFEDMLTPLIDDGKKLAMQGTGLLLGIVLLGGGLVLVAKSGYKSGMDAQPEMVKNARKALT